MGTTLNSLILSLKYYLFLVTQSSLIIPGFDVPGSPIKFPLRYGFSGFAVLIMVHEFSHGTLSLVEDSIKSTGV